MLFPHWPFHSTSRVWSHGRAPMVDVRKRGLFPEEIWNYQSVPARLLRDTRASSQTRWSGLVRAMCFVASYTPSDQLLDEMVRYLLFLFRPPFLFPTSPMNCYLETTTNEIITFPWWMMNLPLYQTNEITWRLLPPPIKELSVSPVPGAVEWNS